MIRQTKVEISKIWTNTAFLLSFALLLAINLILLWGQSLNDTIPPSAYRQFASETQHMSLGEMRDYVDDKYTVVNAIATIEGAQRDIAAGFLSAEAVNSSYGTLYEDYYELYLSGEYLTYCDNILVEYAFLRTIKGEFDQVWGYNDFRESIDAKAAQIKSVSIFSSDDTFVSRNILKTQEDYAKLGEIRIGYSPQKGLRQAITFQLSDLVALFAMVFMAFTSLRYERDKGLLQLIRSTPGGRLRCSASKVLAMAFGALVIVAGIYASNILFSEMTYGIGSLLRPVQSNPFLMRSTLQINVLQYLGLYVFTKWLALSVIGVWILIAALIPNRPTMGYILALAFPLISEILRRIIPFTSSLYLLRYINIASLMQTNEILGNYLNINIAGTPISIVYVVVSAGLFYFLTFCVAFVSSFCRLDLQPRSRSHKRKKSAKKITTSLYRHETYKSLIMQGGAVVLILILGFQFYRAINEESYISPTEIYFRNYMDVLEGDINNDKIQFLNNEYENFRPIIELDQDLQNGYISHETYQAKMIPYTHILDKYRVFREIYNTASEILKSGTAVSFIYESGYPFFLGSKGNGNIIECLLACLASSIIFAPIFSTEKSSGMYSVISATPRGRRYLLNIKLGMCATVSVIIAISTLLYKFWVMLRDYSFSAVLLPLSNLSEFSHIDTNTPILILIILAVLIRILACFSACAIVLLLSSTIDSPITTTIISILVLCLPPLIGILGQESAAWLSLYPVFHFAVLLADPGLAPIAWAYLIFFFLLNIFIITYLYSRRDISEVHLGVGERFITYT